MTAEVAGGGGRMIEGVVIGVWACPLRGYYAIVDSAQIFKVTICDLKHGNAIILRIGMVGAEHPPYIHIGFEHQPNRVGNSAIDSITASGGVSDVFS